MSCPTELIKKLFETIKLTHNVKLEFNTGRAFEVQEKSVIAFDGQYFQCTHMVYFENDQILSHDIFESAQDFISKYFLNHVFISSICIEDSFKNKSCVFYNLGRTQTLV